MLSRQQLGINQELNYKLLFFYCIDCIISIFCYILKTERKTLSTFCQLSCKKESDKELHIWLQMQFNLNHLNLKLILFRLLDSLSGFLKHLSVAVTVGKHWELLESLSLLFPLSVGCSTKYSLTWRKQYL